jgi:hypothetical protein
MHRLSRISSMFARVNHDNAQAKHATHLRPRLVLSIAATMIQARPSFCALVCRHVAALLLDCTQP